MIRVETLLDIYQIYTDQSLNFSATEDERLNNCVKLIWEARLQTIEMVARKTLCSKDFAEWISRVDGNKKAFESKFKNILEAKNGKDERRIANDASTIADEISRT